MRLFNSIYCDIFKHQNINDDTAFLHSWFGDQGINATGQVDIFMQYTFADTLSEVCDRLLIEYAF